MALVMVGVKAAQAILGPAFKIGPPGLKDVKRPVAGEFCRFVTKWWLYRGYIYYKGCRRSESKPK